MSELLSDVHSVGKQFISGTCEEFPYFSVLYIQWQCNAYTYRCPTKNHAA